MNPELLYERLASQIAKSISIGAMAPGTRLPSIRQACATWKVSPATVFQAYSLLESQSMVETRPRSGHFVKACIKTHTMKPAPAAIQAEAGEVVISELVFELLGSTRDMDVVPLGSAFPSPELFPFEALARSGARSMRRVPAAQITGALTAGDETLRAVLRERQQRMGVSLRSDEIVITNGAMEALNLCLQAVTRQGDVVVVESPTFYAALQAIERLNLRALEVRTDPADGVDLEALEGILARERVAACWVMTSFQNPLGSLMPTERKQALVKLLAQHRIPLIEDDVYGELYNGIQRPPPAKAFDEAGLVLHCSSFSKCLAPGYRVGWAAAGRFATDVQRLKMMTSLATSLPPQRAIADYLMQGGYERHLRNLRTALAAQQQRAQRQIKRFFPAGTRFTHPTGGYFLWVEMPQNVDVMALHRQALAAGISTAPGVLFSADRRFQHHLRLNVGHPGDPRVDVALRQLGDWARELSVAL